MFGHLTIKEQLRKEQEKNRELVAQLAKVLGDVEYVAMMTDVELDQDGEVDANE